jgi:hypothetical protein
MTLPSAEARATWREKIALASSWPDFPDYPSCLQHSFLGNEQ